MIVFTTGDILKLLGGDVSATTFDRWCNEWAANGVVEAIHGGIGHGNHRVWTFVQAVGFVVANEYRKSERGCATIFIGRTVAAFGNVTESWLQQQLEEGRHCYVGPHYGQPVLQADSGYGSFADLKAAYDRVLKHVQNRKPTKRGRKPAKVRSK